MANTVSQLMSNLRASPVVMSSIGEDHGRKRAKICRFATVSADGAGHQYRLCEMKAHDRITSIKVWNSADAGMTGIDIGIFTPEVAKVGTETLSAIDQDGLTDGQSLASAAVGTELYGVGTNAVAEADYGKQLWEAAPNGPADDPIVGTLYEIVAVVAGNPGGGGDYAFIFEYTAGD